MTETLYRKSWQPLAEADKSSEQVIRWNEGGKNIFPSYVGTAVWNKQKNCWLSTNTWKPVPNFSEQEFLCLEPVEVETDDFPKVI